MDLNLRGQKGSHHIYENLTTVKITVVPMHDNTDIPKGTYYGILKQTGLDRDSK